MKNLLSSPLLSTKVNYCSLPPTWTGGVRRIGIDDDSNDELWSSLVPPPARVFGLGPGQISDRKRAKRKEDQLRIMMDCVVALLRHVYGSNSSGCSGSDTYDDTSGLPSATLVDFGGGSGHLAVPLARLLPQCNVIVVDLSKKSLSLLHDKVRNRNSTMNDHSDHDSAQEQPQPVLPTLSTASPLSTNEKDERMQACESIPNLFTFCGPIEAWIGPMDLGIGLHLCGEATDVALRKCAQLGALAMVFCPCCVGKLNRNRKNPYIWQATGTNTPTIQYPQSTSFQQQQNWNENDNQDWNALVQAADYAEAICETPTPTLSSYNPGALQRAAKALLETDRRLYLEETFGYQTALTRMEPWSISPKNDILLAWKTATTRTSLPGWSLEANPACQREIEKTKEYLLGTRTAAAHPFRSSTSSVPRDADLKPGQPVLTASSLILKEDENIVKDYSMEWTMQEEEEIRQQIEDYFLDPSRRRGQEETGTAEEVLIFPVGMGRRRRKLIHWVAEQNHLDHWSVGRSKGEKTVAVALPREPKTISSIETS